MIASSGKWLRIYLAGAMAFAASVAILVFAGILPPHYDREFSDADFGPPVLDVRFVAFEDLEGWRQDDPGPALDAFVRSCEIFEAGDPQAPANPYERPDAASGGETLSGVNADWIRPCAEARAILVSAYGDPSARRGALRSFFEFHFRPVAISVRRDPLPDGRARRAGPRIEREGVFTGYFEPVYAASRQAKGAHTAPLYPRPDDLVEVDLGLFRDELKGERIAGLVEDGRLKPYADHAGVNAGALDEKVEPIAWLDPNDLFFLQIQGSGRLVFDDGEILRVGYAGQNGHEYTAIGRVMVERRILPLEAVTMQSIRRWLAEATPEAARSMREANASYVFFRTLDAMPAHLGPLGAQGVPLTPGRSLAVDRRYHTLGAPVWVDIEPVPEAGGEPIRRLMIAQDTGGAIRGPVRGDVFWGAGEEAAVAAGAMNAAGEMVVLLPRRLADRLETPQGAQIARRSSP